MRSVSILDRLDLKHNTSGFGLNRIYFRGTCGFSPCLANERISASVFFGEASMKSETSESSGTIS